jgi:hypothetical protein
MNRRTVLATVGALSVGTAGCLDRANSGSRPPTTSTQSPADSSNGSTEDTPPTPSQRFDDVACPTFEETERTVCFHTLGEESAPVFVEPSTDLFEPAPDGEAVETIEFVLHNDSDAGVGLNPYDWAIKRQTAGGWEHVVPDVHPEPWTTVEAGETSAWELGVDGSPEPDSGRAMAISGDLADGVYAFTVTVDNAVECIALFEVRRA